MAIAFHAMKLGIDVYRPVADGGRYDLIFDLGVRLDRVQCKYAPLQGDTIVVRIYSTRRAARGPVRKRYAPGEIDAVAAYCLEVDGCFYLTEATVAGRTQIMLRVAPSRHNQAAGVNWADDYRLERLEFRPRGP